MPRAEILDIPGIMEDGIISWSVIRPTVEPKVAGSNPVRHPNPLTSAIDQSNKIVRAFNASLGERNGSV